MKKYPLLVCLLFAALTVFGQNAAYATLSDVAYYPDTMRAKDAYIAQRCVLDIYYPTNKKNFPTVVWFHGGGLSGGTKEIPKELKERGFGVVAVNYRMYPQAVCPAYIEDAAMAVAWVFDHIAEYGGNPDAVVLSGHSAGAYLAGMVGLDKRWLQAHHHDANRIAGLFLLSAQAITHFAIRGERGISDKQPVVDEFSLLFHVRPDTPPIYLMTGDRELEMLGRYEENAYLWRMFRLNGNQQVVLYEFGGYGHNMLQPAFPLMIKSIKKLPALK
jgi:pimeloyl-ACP methyl ester carboxylesterase